MALLPFDVSAAPKRENTYELLPMGWYTAQVIGSEIVPLKDDKGQALKLTFEVLSDGYRGRKLWARLNVRHSGSPESERIANEQLRELCESIGVTRMQDTVELHNKPVQIRVKIREDKSGKYDPANDVVGYKAVGGAVPASPGFPMARPAAPAVAPSAAPANAPAAGSTPPWAKKAA